MRDFLKTIGQAILSAVVLFIFLELFCRVIGIPPYASDFAEKIIYKEHLTTHKPKNEFRIFTYGESTMHGAHYAPVSTPARWLEAYLKDFLPNQKIKVVNFARMGRDSNFTFETFSKTLVYKPDLVIFYNGHNEMLPGNLVEGSRIKERKFQFRFKKLILKSRLISRILRAAIQLRLSRKFRNIPEDRMEYDEIETSPKGEIGAENSVPRNSAVYERNIINFRTKLNLILDLAERAHTHIVFFKPASNLKDFAPTYSMHLQKLSPEKLERWNSFFQDGKKSQENSNEESAIDFYAKAYALDPTYADLCFRLGQLYFKVGEIEKAGQFFVEARDNDAIVCRATQGIYQVFQGLEKSRGLQLIDTEKTLKPEVSGGILGMPVIEDNVHPSIKGQSRMGLAVAKKIAKMNWIAPREEWQFNRERSFEEMSKGLGVTPDLQFTAYLKLCYYFGSRFESRIFYAQKALEIYPHHSKALRHLAWNYWLSGNQEKAFEIYGILKKRDPEELQAVFKTHPTLEKLFNEKSQNRVTNLK